MGKRALKSHMDGKKPDTKPKAFSCFFLKLPVKKNLNATSTRTLLNQAVPKKALSCNETDKTKADMYWVLNVAANNHFLNSCDDNNCLFHCHVSRQRHWREMQNRKSQTSICTKFWYCTTSQKYFD